MTVLDQEMYTEPEAARLLAVPPTTLNYWLEGGERRGKLYEPIVRETRKGGHPAVTWAEFVECAWLRQYRRKHQVPMKELRAFISQLRDKLGVPYPLAHAKAFAYQGKLIIEETQRSVGLDPEFYLVAPVGGQMMLTAPGEEYHERLHYADEIVTAWRPHDDPKSSVLIQPNVRFGRPAVAGISTDVLWEQVDAGASIAEVAEDFGISSRDVRWAVSYESARAA
ncbi:DUF433 domain-containing protein [Amycolatopsis sp. H20-H5]|uniref:DUF433 domain-containing protein n=1 Tax=Amycolatopsis sp. H20-H5 TaxID=3046309 RepID=UPI002DBF1BE7|nr:DUF433 domain-containing protein [Amycolatopsis sp. H20-H5]MEC3974566.1 DUF433 domain-containing protein [Amycolatopsis sp. H20-H5]